MEHFKIKLSSYVTICLKLKFFYKCRGLGLWLIFIPRFFSKYVNKLYAFDSFEGLREDWVGWQDPAGTFNLDKKVPKLNANVIPIVGWVQDTLDNFLEEKKPKINFVHMDMDTYD